MAMPNFSKTSVIQERKPHIWAHRGARSVAPENTLCAGKIAAEQGANGWEIDIQMTSDGQLVLLHDNTLDRTTNAKEVFGGSGPYPVSDYPFAALQKLSFGQWFGASDPFGQITAGRVSARALNEYAHEGVATLTQALDLSHSLGLFINVEIKDAQGAFDDSIVERTAEVLSKKGFLSTVLISSFRFDYLVRLRQLLPHVQVGYLVNALTGKVLDDACSIRAKAIHPQYSGLNEALIQEAHHAGLELNVWTVNESKDIETLCDWDVSAVISDFPSRAINIVKKKCL